MTPRREASALTLGVLVWSAKPSIGCAYACPEVLKSITPLELLLSYCVTDTLRMSLKQVPPYPGRPGVDVSGGWNPYPLSVRKGVSHLVCNGLSLVVLPWATGNV